MDHCNTTIGEIVAEDYRTASIFENHGIDFCCGGKLTLTDVCKEKGLDPALLLQEIHAVREQPIERSQDYSSWEMSFLADYIVNVHHAYLNRNTTLLAGYTKKIAEVHGGHHPELFEIAAIYEKIAIDLTAHLQQEEEECFPALKRADLQRKAGNAPAEKDVEIIRRSIRELLREHEEVGAAIHQIRHLARGYAIPGDACNTFLVTYRQLKEFEDDLHKHVHLENNILFRTAVKLMDS